MEINEKPICLTVHPANECFGFDPSWIVPRKIVDYAQKVVVMATRKVVIVYKYYLYNVYAPIHPYQ